MSLVLGYLAATGLRLVTTPHPDWEEATFMPVQPLPEDIVEQALNAALESRWLEDAGARGPESGRRHEHLVVEGVEAASKGAAGGLGQKGKAPEQDPAEGPR